MATIQRPSKSNSLIARLFHARDTIHICHLKTTSYAQHKALDEFYNEILDLADGIAESIQGIYGLQEISIPQAVIVDPISYLKEFYAFLQQDAYGMYQESWIKNQIDEVSQLTASTLYKLQYLS